MSIIKGMWCEDVDWFHLARDGVQLWLHVNTVMILLAP